jgi:membrane protein implicated in regulation of membrane protease activity
MGDFLNALSFLETVLFVIAASATIILIIQTILSFAGMGDDGDFDSGGADAGGDFDADADLAESASAAGGNIAKSEKEAFDADGLRLFTVRGVLAFLAVGSWIGLVASMAGINEFVALFFAFASGTASLFGIAKLMQFLMSLHNDGTLKMNNAIGQTGTVYIRIPEAEKGTGKVNVTIQERYCEFDAITESREGIKTGELVYVTDVRQGNVLVVEKVK